MSPHDEGRLPIGEPALNSTPIKSVSSIDPLAPLTRATAAELVSAARRFLDAMEHFHAVTGPQAVVEKVHAQTGCEPNDNSLREAERRLRTYGLEATFTIQRAIDDLSAGASAPGELR